MSAGTLHDIDIGRMMEEALSSAQRQLIDSKPAPLRERLYGRIRSALLASVRVQIEYCTRVGVDPVALGRLILKEEEVWQLEQIRQEQARQLVAAGASFIMAKALLGMSRREFDALRKELGISATVTRKSVDDSESARIYRHWETLGKPADLDGFLNLHQASGQPLYVLWGLVQDWRQVQQRISQSRRQAGGW
ncbi:MAG: DUF2857 family protein [Candidatus Thiothrix singaporensis]|uniref:DUF2857 family protein n=1 Tax=Candidatus Thiothrix singaporensis TaxID=2799669 RepID=A0A7L6ASG5_9GAMM|nr:MAG: DUF2857 family protein [Candidatus Thiothrix singaporensis]